MSAVTMKDIAVLAGVSQQAVSATLNKKGSSRVSAEKRAKIEEIARQLNYTPNVHARKLTGHTGEGFSPDTTVPRRFHTLAIVSCWNYDYAFRLLNILAEPYGYSFISVQFDRKTFQKNPGILLNFPVDGFLFCFSTLRKEQEAILRQHRIPIVLSADWQFDERWMDIAELDHEAGLKLLLGALHAGGYRRIAFMDFDRVPEYRPYLEKIKALMQTLNGENWSPELFYAEGLADELYLQYGEDCYTEQGERAGKYFASLPEQPDAVIMADCRFHAGLEKSGLHALPAVFGPRMRGDENFLRVTYDFSASLEWCAVRLIDRVEGLKSAPETHLIQPVLYE